jgi:diadenosine tetraphosphate (Ap4A) HIT family hydrolase
MDQAAYEQLVQRFRPESTRLSTRQHWEILLRPTQVTLGSMILLPNRPVEDFGHIEPPMASELFQSIDTAQSVLRAVFNPDKFNLIAAMMKDPFVHFHLIPRYSTPRKFSGYEWTDDAWPALVAFGKANVPPFAEDELIDVLRRQFHDLRRGGRH